MVLYDKRYRVFDAARELIRDTVIRGVPSDEVLTAFLIGTGDATFLFDDKLAGYLEEMRDHVAKMRAIHGAISGDISGEYAAARRQVGEHQVWLVNQSEGLAGKFKPFLQLDKRKRRGLSRYLRGTSWSIR